VVTCPAHVSCEEHMSRTSLVWNTCPAHVRCEKLFFKDLKIKLSSQRNTPRRNRQEHTIYIFQWAPSSVSSIILNQPPISRCCSMLSRCSPNKMIYFGLIASLSFTDKILILLLFSGSGLSYDLVDNAS